MSMCSATIGRDHYHIKSYIQVHFHCRCYWHDITVWRLWSKHSSITNECARQWDEKCRVRSREPSFKSDSEGIEHFDQIALALSCVWAKRKKEQGGHETPDGWQCVRSVRTHGHIHLGCREKVRERWKQDVDVLESTNQLIGMDNLTELTNHWGLSDSHVAGNNGDSSVCMARRYDVMYWEEHDAKVEPKEYPSLSRS